MSIEICILSDRRLDSIADWQAAIDREGFALRLDPDGTIDQLRGHLPAWRGEAQAGFECYHDDPAEIIDVCTDIDFGRRWTQCLSLRFGGDLYALWGASAAAAAYARATGGVVFDTEANELLTPDQAVEAARAIERDNERDGWTIEGLLRGARPTEP